MSRTGRLLRLAGWAVGIGVTLLALAATGHGPLSPPPLGSPTGWPEWVEAREPMVAAFAILRLLAVGGCWYLVATTVVGALLRLLRADILVSVSDRVTVAPVRHLLAGSLTLTLAGIGPTAAGAQTVPTTTTTTHVTSSTSTAVPATTVDTIVMRRLPPARADADAPATPTADVTARVDGRYTVVSGDCFWTIADDMLHRSWGRAPTEAEIVPYWRRLIEANRAELADPGNADLIFPGQVFAVPTPPALPGES